MKVSRDLLRGILEPQTLERLCEHDLDQIANRLNQLEGIKHHLNKIDMEELNLRKRHSEELARLEQTRLQIRKSCSHPIRTSEPDPAGGPHHVECDICGANLTEREVRFT